jgi:hypothetical protein
VIEPLPVIVEQVGRCNSRCPFFLDHSPLEKRYGWQCSWGSAKDQPRHTAVNDPCHAWAAEQQLQITVFVFMANFSFHTTSHRCYSLEEVEGFLSGYESAAEHFALPSLKFEFDPPHPFRGPVYEP